MISFSTKTRHNLEHHIHVVILLVALWGCETEWEKKKFIITDETDTTNYWDDDTDTHTHPGMESDSTEPNDTIHPDDSETTNSTDSMKDTETVSDECPDDPDKIAPGRCGCGTPENACITILVLSYGGISGNHASQQYFNAEVPAGASDIVVQVFGGKGDADLFVKIDDEVNLSNWDCRPYIVGEGVTETCKFEDTGMYNMMISAHGDIEGWSLTVSYIP